MTTSVQTVTIKGTKEGLHFRFHSGSTFETLVRDLEQKLNISNSNFLQGPLTHVHLHLGTLYLNEEQQGQLVDLIENAGSLLVKNIYSDVITVEEANTRMRQHLPKIEVGTIRSGQVLESDQDILVLGDVNPGGWVISHGNIYIMGALKGIAHAGYNGDRNKIIVASVMEPTQLRIADVIETAFEATEIELKVMKFAHVENEMLELSAIQSISRFRPELTDSVLKGL